MAEMMTVKQASQRWGIFDSRITKLCREGKILGAIKNGKSWVIPADTPKPADNRYKSQSNTPKLERLPLPVGVSEYRRSFWMSVPWYRCLHVRGALARL